MKKLMAVLTAVVTLFALGANSVLASGNPYTPHTPVPTGLENTVLFYVVAVVSFALGMSVLAIAKSLKTKQSLK